MKTSQELNNIFIENKFIIQKITNVLTTQENINLLIDKVLKNRKNLLANEINQMINCINLIGLKINNENYRLKFQQKKRIIFSNVISEHRNGIIFYNPKFFNNMSIHEIIGNYAHEFCHYLGFNHEYKFNNSRKWHFIYLIGYFYEFSSKNFNFIINCENDNILLIELFERYIKTEKRWKRGLYVKNAFNVGYTNY